MHVSLLGASPDPSYTSELEGQLRVCQYSMGQDRFAKKSCECIHMYLGSGRWGLASSV